MGAFEGNNGKISVQIFKEDLEEIFGKRPWGVEEPVVKEINKEAKKEEIAEENEVKEEKDLSPDELSAKSLVDSGEKEKEASDSKDEEKDDSEEEKKD